MKHHDLTRGARVRFTTAEDIELEGTIKSYPLGNFYPVTLYETIMGEPLTNYVHISAIKESHEPDSVERAADLLRYRRVRDGRHNGTSRSHH